MSGWNMIDAELADTIEAERTRQGRAPVSRDPRDPQPPVDSVDCPDCGAKASIAPLGFCSVCGLLWDDLVAAHEFYETLIAAAGLEASLPSPRDATIPKDGRQS